MASKFTERMFFLMTIIVLLCAVLMLVITIQTESVRRETKRDDLAELYSKVRVYCWVMTNPANIETKAVAVWKTWGKRCNKVVFMTTQPTSLVPAVVLTIPEGRQHLTSKSVQAFDYAYHHHLKEFDWFLKADDDTFVIVENLRYFLSNFSSNDSIYHGQLFKTVVKQGFYSGGAGYVLSREALRRLVENGIQRGGCNFNITAEDVAIAFCMERVGVRTGDSRDNLGQERFHLYSLWTHLGGDFPDGGWIYDNAFHEVRKGLTCCSDVAVTFHYVQYQDMYIYYYLLYHLRPHGDRQLPPSTRNGPPPPRGQTRNSSDPDDNVF